MSAKITKFYPKGAAENIDNVLEQAIGCYDTAIVIGYDKDGCMRVRGSTQLTLAEILWLIESFKTGLMNGDYSE